MSAFADAAVTKVSAGRSPTPRVYKLGHVPVSPGYPYSVLTVTREGADGYTLDATHGTRDYRVTVQHFGKSEDSVAEYATAADERLLDQSLTVVGYECGPMRHQLTAAGRDPDDGGVLGVTQTYLFTTTKEPA